MQAGVVADQEDAFGPLWNVSDQFQERDGTCQIQLVVDHGLGRAGSAMAASTCLSVSRVRWAAEHSTRSGTIPSFARSRACGGGRPQPALVERAVEILLRRIVPTRFGVAQQRERKHIGAVPQS